MRAPVRQRTGAGELKAARRGMALVLTTLAMVMLVGFVALSVDVGYIAHVKTELKRTTDAGALAGAGTLVQGQQAAIEQVYQYIALNPVGGTTVPEDDVTIELGLWNEQTRTFSAGGDQPSAVRVFIDRSDQPLFFARIFGQEDFDLTDESVAMYQPRDIMLVLDYSASMNDDSELQAWDRPGLSTAAVEANIQTIYQQLGSPTFGTMVWDQTLSSSWTKTQVKNYLGISSLAYPYSGGSWNEYIDYVRKATSNELPTQYKHHFGYKTFVNYLQEKRPMKSETPGLWNTSEQPITALKNAVTVFLAYLQEVDTDDRLGLSVYTAADGTAVLESGLTSNMQFIEDVSRQRQAGHYNHYTNIGDGIKKARLELQNNARPGAFKMIVLITDGIANRPTDTTTGKNYAISEATTAANAGYPIVTVSLGAAADENLMQSIADLSGGIHFNVPGGQAVADYEEDLKDVFRQIADDRPLKLVK